jgi:putative transposase
MRSRTEQDRCRAVERYLGGESPTAICVSLGYSTRWFYKWLKQFRTGNPDWFRSKSRRPHQSPNCTSREIEEIVTIIRLSLYNSGRFYGAQAIRWEMEDLCVRPLPSLRTINRILSRAELTHRRIGGYEPKGKAYPKLVAEKPSDMHQTDFVGPLYLRGGVRFYGLNSVDLATGRCASEAVLTRTAQTTINAFWESWLRLGMPHHQQVDNEMSFYGSPRYPRAMGPLIRLGLLHEIEVWFIPMSEPWRNGVVEKFNNIWKDKFLHRVDLASEIELRAENLAFEERHNSRYRYSKLGGKTPSQALEATGAELRFPSKSKVLRHPLPAPESGRYHLVRFVRSEGKLNIFGELFPAPPEAIYEYVQLTIDVERQRLSVFLDGNQIDEHQYLLRK